MCRRCTNEFPNNMLFTLDTKRAKGKEFFCESCANLRLKAEPYVSALSAKRGLIRANAPNAIEGMQTLLDHLNKIGQT